MSTKGGRRLSTAEKDERRLSSAVARIRKGPPPHLWHPLDQFSGSGTNVVGAPSANARPKATKLADYDEAAAQGATFVADKGLGQVPAMLVNGVLSPLSKSGLQLNETTGSYHDLHDCTSESAGVCQGQDSPSPWMVWSATAQPRMARFDMSLTTTKPLDS